MKILFIDDERYRAKAVVAYFEQVCAWSVELAADADEAMAVLTKLLDARQALDVILLDIMMDPGNTVPASLSGGGKDTGLVLLGFIAEKLERASRRVPIIVYTARIDLEELHTNPQVARYIQKPRTARELAPEIEEVVEGMAS